MSTALKDQLKQQLQDSTPDEEATQQEAKAPGPFDAFKRASSAEVAAWYRSMSVLVRAGYPLSRALALIGKSVSHPDLSAVVRKMGMEVDGGAPLSKAMARYPWYFGRASCAVITAAEESAQLGQAMNFLADHAERELALREKATQAVTYPITVITLSMFVLVGIMYFAVPQFAGFLADAGVEVTGMAAGVYAISEILRIPIVPPMIFGAIFMMGFGAYSWRKSNPVGFYRAMSRVPIFGAVLEKASLTRFTSVFHMLTTSGVQVPRALELATDVVDNARIGSIAKQMKANIDAGKTMGEALKGSKLPPIFTDMVTLAEETGKLDEILPSVARALEADVDRTSGRISAMAEPGMLVVIGGVVLCIMLAFFLPYMEMLAGVSAFGN
jgi:type IV pilus assembly protein PilC